VGTLVALFASNEASVQGLGVLERVAAAAAPMLEGAQGAPGPTDDERAPDPGIEVSGRVAFQIGLAREAARARRQHRPLAVVLVAVDRPDRVLADLADLLEGIRPAASRLYRVGATSFALVLPGHTSEHARGLVGDLQAARRQRPDTAVSEISAAVVELEDEDDVVSLTARAGTALEAARQPHLSPADGGG
jgi:GGDEF domain-containing protein